MMSETASLLPGCGRVPVWAPHAERVELARPEGREPMVRADDGWWLAPQELPAGSRYAFVLDGAGPFPDPRSPFQPEGVSSWSMTVDPVCPPPATPTPRVLGGVLYELHVGTFTPEGTLDAAAARLDHVRDLGVDTVELMPVASFPGRNGWGYDGVALYSVHAAYGGPDAYRRFVEAAHDRGLGVCQDLVLNHLGPQGNYLAQFGPYFTSRHPTPWGEGFNLDGDDCAAVRDYLIGAAHYLYACLGVDALRLDAVHAIADDSPLHLLAELSQRRHEWTARLGRDLTLIAESDLNDDQMITPVERGGMGMDGQWDDDVHHALHVAFTGETHGYYSDFADAGALEKVYGEAFFHNGTYSSFRGRDWGKPLSPHTKLDRFVVFTQNHDQVGNRAIGDRPHEKLSLIEAGSQAALCLLGPFTPMLFMGEEWATSTPFQFFTDFSDADLAQAVSEGRLREFSGHGWEEIYSGSVTVPDPQDHSTREASVLTWEERCDGPHADMLAWYRRLIELRRAYPCTMHELKRCEEGLSLSRGDLTVVVSRLSEDRPLPEGRVLATWPPESSSLVAGGCVVVER